MVSLAPKGSLSAAQMPFNPNRIILMCDSVDEATLLILLFPFSLPSASQSSLLKASSFILKSILQPWICQFGIRAKHLAMPCGPLVPSLPHSLLQTSLEDQRGLGSNQHCHGSSPACGASVTTGVDGNVPTDHQCIATCKEKRNNYYYCQISSRVKASSMSGTILGTGNRSLNQNENSCPCETYTLVKCKWHCFGNAMSKLCVLWLRL